MSRDNTIQKAMNISLSKSLQPCERSALEKNFKASISSTKPSTTFTWLSQPPEAAILLSIPGNMANNANGKANPTEKPNIPTAGPAIPPLPAATSNGPTIGPVQEKDTMANVRAMKNMPLKLPTPALESVAFVQEEGKVISNAPRNEMPNITKTKKKTRLAIQLVESAFSAPAPKTADTNTPKTVKMIIIERD